jgi:hypothetical protein
LAKLLKSELVFAGAGRDSGKNRDREERRAVTPGEVRLA